MCMDDCGQLKMVMVTCYASGRWEGKSYAKRPVLNL